MQLWSWNELDLKYAIWWNLFNALNGVEVNRWELVAGLLPVAASRLHVTQALFNHVSEQQIAFLCPRVLAVVSFGSWHVQFSGFCRGRR